MFVAKEELSKMLAEDELRDSILLVFANKQDLPNAMKVVEITDKLGLHSLRNHQWFIQVRLRVQLCHKGWSRGTMGLRWQVQA